MENQSPPDLVRQAVVQDAQIVVIKLGTNVLARQQSSGVRGLDNEQLNTLADQMVRWQRAGKKLVLVSSGAIGAGLAKLGQTKRPTNLPELQAAAAIGQSELMKAWDEAFARHRIKTAQILLTAGDVHDRMRYLNARNTILQLLRWDVVPIINENDTISVNEIRFGDNDQLAAMVTNLLRASLLIVLSVVEGLYEGDFESPDRKLLSTVLDVDQVLNLASNSTSGLGTGGMKSKLQAALIATLAGESVWIAGGRIPGVLDQLLAGQNVGTFFPARGKAMSSWKRWIGFTAKPKGEFHLDRGAVIGLIEHQRSLLPVGVTQVIGDFTAGNIVDLVDPAGHCFARGLSNYSANEMRQILRDRQERAQKAIEENSASTRSKPNSRDESPRHAECIHRDNLVMLD